MLRCYLLLLLLTWLPLDFAVLASLFNTADSVKQLTVCMTSSLRVPVEQLRMGIGREGREMTEMNALEEPQGGLRHGASLRDLTLELPTESGTGRNRPSLTLPPGSSSPVSLLLSRNVPSRPF